MNLDVLNIKGALFNLPFYNVCERYITLSKSKAGNVHDGRNLFMNIITFDIVVPCLLQYWESWQKMKWPFLVESASCKAT